MPTQFDATDWLATALRAVVSYLTENFDPNIYDIIGSFPPDRIFNQQMPFTKTIIHAEIDDIRNPTLGFGENVTTLLYDQPTTGQVIPIEAKRHIINFDLGVWASEESGGATARLRAYQRLDDLLNGSAAYEAFFAAVGMEIQAFYGGNFLLQTINDMEVWNIANITFIVQCFSSNQKLVTPQTYIDNIIQDQNVTVSDVSAR